MAHSVAARFKEPDVRKILALPYPMLKNWNAHFKMEREAEDRMRAEAKQAAEMNAALRDMQSDPHFRRSQ